MLSRLINRLTRRIHGAPPLPAGEKTPSPSEDTTPSRGVPLIPSWEPGETILGRYQVDQVMSGAMGKVYISKHLGWGIRIAIKAPRPEVLSDREGMRRILKEANSWVRMGMHPNIASCYFVQTIDRIPHIFIEYIDGGSLSDWIKSGRCRNLRTALSLAIQFCHGMEYTHRQGIIHRDIKPANILISKNSLVKITDFGIVLAHGDSRADNGSGPGPAPADPEATVGFRGTVGYASPEQFRDAHTVDLRTDIFSFGICLWLMLCGKKPFTSNGVRQPIPDPVPADPDVSFPASLKEVLTRSVAFSPDDRYSDFAGMRQALNDAYVAVFKTACPYAELNNVDLRADSLNNRAVSLFELGQDQEAAACLQKTLEINDILPEAVYNMLLLQWSSGQMKPARILRQIETSRKRGIQAPWFKDLEAAVKRGAAGNVKGRSGQASPSFRLCIPKNSLEIFREGQLHASVQRNLLDHIENKRYAACHDILMTSWHNSCYRKDPIFNQVYDRLLRVGTKRKVVGVQRFLTLKGFGAPTSHLAYIRGTKKIVSAGPDGKIILRDLTSSRQVAFLNQDDRPVTSLAACPQGKHLAVGKEDGTISLFSTQTGKLLARDNSHSGAVRALAFSDNGRSLASGGGDGTLKIRKLSDGTEIAVSVKEGGAVRAVAFVHKGQKLLTGSEDGSLRLSEADGRECSRIIEAHAMPVVALAAAPDGIRFVTASTDRSIRCWESTTGRCLRSIAAHEEAISSVLFLEDNQTLASGCEDDLIKLWDSTSGDCLAILDGRGDGIESLAPGPKAHTFLSGRKDGAIVLWMIIYQLDFE